MGNQNNVWPDDIHMPCLVVLSGKDRLVPAHSIHILLQAELERRRLVRAAKQVDGEIVIQTGFPAAHHQESRLHMKLPRNASNIRQASSSSSLQGDFAAGC